MKTEKPGRPGPNAPVKEDARAGSAAVLGHRPPPHRVADLLCDPPHWAPQAVGDLQAEAPENDDGEVEAEEGRGEAEHHLAGEHRHKGVGDAGAAVAGVAFRAGEVVVVAALLEPVLRVDDTALGAAHYGPHVGEGRHAAAVVVEEVGGLHGASCVEQAPRRGEVGQTRGLAFGAPGVEVHEGGLHRLLHAVRYVGGAGEGVGRRERRA
eukprot:CAMPEP_0113701234 /NCGR_PEP_ID=MMETSP0038_2-20120614/24446_1 /TAXON_ID=2898 /ORGANISM="Cryptomonas paramecium" /LENGTH=208 /DNA_ID=CAMNT_0000625073 /DNA_START=477 /DNA_END=1104 /DNA_ORIENTATION=+ /assembly_acc=CAM_ASM_000170